MLRVFAVDDIIAFVNLADELEYFRCRVLEVIIHRYDIIALCVIEARDGRVMLAKVP